LMGEWPAPRRHATIFGVFGASVVTVLPAGLMER
jgi:hypothetical protein